MGHNSASVSGGKRECLERHERAMKRKKQIPRNEAACALLNLQRQPDPALEDPAVDEPTKDQQTQTDLEWDRELQRLIADNVQLRQTVQEKDNIITSQSVFEQSLQEDESKLLFYTGLPSWLTLMTILKLISPYLPNSTNCKLTPFEQMMLFLTKIRLNLSPEFTIGYSM